MASAFEIVMNNRKDLVNKIISNMEKGYIFTKSAWNKSALRPQNPVSNLYYKGGNRVRLMNAAIENEYTDPRWCTFKQAQANDWKIKKGSKGVLLEKWIFSKTETQTDENGKKIKVEVQLKNPVVNYFTVFNGSQIENIPELDLGNKTHDESYKLAENVMKSSECKIKEIAQPKAFYRPSEDTIYLPLRESFKSYDSFLSVAIHEMSHSTGYEGRLNRPLINAFGSPDYAREELNAELGSAFTKSDLGIALQDEALQDHSNYLKSWIGVLKDDPNEFFRACAEAEKISDYIVNNYERYIDKVYTSEIKKDIKECGFKPTSNLVESIKEFNSITGKKNSVIEIAALFKNKPTGNKEYDSALEKITNEFLKQENDPAITRAEYCMER